MQFFFQAVVLLYGCTIRMPTKHMQNKLDSNYTRMLQAILNKSWRPHPTKKQLYSHLPPITKTIQFRLTRQVEHCWRSGHELISNILLWTPSHGRAKADDQQEAIYNSSMAIQDVSLKTYQERWTIEMVAGEGQGYPCWWHDMMMMMMMINLQSIQIMVLSLHI